MPDEHERHELDELTGGATSAPRSLFRVARSLALVLSFFAVIWVLTVLLDRLPGDTSTGSLVLRGLIGFSIGLVLIAVVRRMLRALAAPPPAPPRTVDARGAEVVYECPVCGTRVRLEVLTTAKPPKHCGEEMEAKLG